ncbi:MAG: DUF177 domain-containing protein [Gammaproteobacteria bacterium]|nr:DUF177 domain-containing protein [Gammaproteobacteria bacterium]
MSFSPYQLARERRELQLEVSLAELPRFAALLAADGDAVAVTVRFERDGQGRCRMLGRLATRQRMRCANCLEVEAFELDVDVDACILSSEEAAKDMVGEVDPLILEGKTASAAELFEDDLLLALPERPCRGREDCPNRPPEVAEALPASERRNPFAALAELKEDGSRSRDGS